MTKLFKKQIKFTQISNELICNPNISCKAKAIYCYLYSRPSGWEFFLGEITRHFKESKCAVRDALKELESNQYIRKIQLKRSDGKFGGQDIEVIWKEDLADTENPPCGEKADTANLDPINTNKENNTNLKENNTDLKEALKEIEDLKNKLYKKTPPIKKETKQFTPPTLQQIKDYCIERKNNIDPNKFLDFYNVSNWIDTKGKQVLNWKLKMVSWENNSKDTKPIDNTPEPTDLEFITSDNWRCLFQKWVDYCEKAEKPIVSYRDTFNKLLKSTGGEIETAKIMMNETFRNKQYIL